MNATQWATWKWACRWRRSLGRLLPALGLWFCLGGSGAWAHVGNPYIVFEGKAGVYGIRAVVKQPEVVPGLAEIHVRVEPETGVVPPKRITVLPLHSGSDRTGAPRPDEALQVEGETLLYRADLWLMARGAYGVEIGLEGEGKSGGTVMVPVNSLATARKPMPEWLGWVLLGLGFILAWGIVLIAAAATREGTLSELQRPEPERTRTAWVVGGLTCFLVIMAVYWGGRWWRYEENNHASRVVFKPFDHQVRLKQDQEGMALELELTDSRATNKNYGLLPDHGKWVHLFLTGQEAPPTLIHLHPVKIHSRLFRSRLPALPAGTYRVFAELTHELGVSQTLTNELVVPERARISDEVSGKGWSDESDSWLPGGQSVSGKAGEMSFPLSNGRMMRLDLQRGGFMEPTVLAVKVTDREGRPAVLEPYLKMMGHAVVMGKDGAVFSHLHPAGTLNMAAAKRLVQKMDGVEAGRQVDLVCGNLETMPADGVAEWARTGSVRFPFLFPQPGSYWIWVQVKIDGKIETARFEWVET